MDKNPKGAVASGNGPNKPNGAPKVNSGETTLERGQP